MHGLLAQVVISSLHKTNLPTSVHSQITLSVVRGLHLLASVDESRPITGQHHLPAAPKGKLLSFRLSQPTWLRIL